MQKVQMLLCFGMKDTTCVYMHTFRSFGGVYMHTVNTQACVKKN
jgi:hypothetical protein